MKLLFNIIIISAGLCFAQIQDNLNNRFMLGSSYEQQGNFEKALSIYEDLYKKQPENFQFFDALNRTYLQLKEYDKSIKLLNERIVLLPQDINIAGLLGKTYHQKGEEAKAFDIWDKALQTYPQNPVNYKIIANYAIERRAFSQAIEILKKGKSSSGDPVMYSYDLANLYSITMQYKEAAVEYCEILKNNPKQLSVVESRISSYINKPESLAPTIAAVEDYHGKNDAAFDYFLAWLYRENGNYDKAYDIYLELDEQHGANGVELFNFAQISISDKQYETAAMVLERIINNYPNAPFIQTSKLAYAKALEETAKQKEDTASGSWKPFHKFIEEDSDIYDKVIDAYNEVIKLYPGSETGLEANLRIGKIYFNKYSDLDEAGNYFNRVISNISAFRFFPEAYEQLGYIELRKGVVSKAYEYFNKILESPAGSEELKNSARYQLARINFYKGDFSSAKKILSEIQSNLKDNTANDAIELSILLNTTVNDSSNLLVFAEGEFLAEQKDFEAAMEKFKSASQGKGVFMLQNLTEIRISEMLIALDSLNSAVNLLEQISSEDSKNIYSDKALYLLGRIYEFGLKDNLKAIEVFEGLLARFPNSLYLDSARAEILKLRNKVS